MFSFEGKCVAPKKKGILEEITVVLFFSLAPHLLYRLKGETCTIGCSDYIIESGLVKVAKHFFNIIFRRNTEINISISFVQDLHAIPN